ncbi:MAG: type I glutamate--ammonia ligase [Candidatus Nanoarchaeia archaeon]|nr:type I glutamate--ammonia ligase [Candidatus Nanoarchaeia archaeon]
MENDEIYKKLKEDNIKFIELEFTDIFGTLKAIEIPVSCIKEAVEKGVWFDGSSIKGFSRIKESDMYLKPDLSTYAILPSTNDSIKTARFLCDTYNPNGSPCLSDPRVLLKKIIADYNKLGFELMAGPEVEFYMFKKDAAGKLSTPEFDKGSYFDCSSNDIGSNVRKEIMVALKSFGIESERAHHEVGIGQHEIGFKYGNVLSTADKVVTLKKIIKSISNNHGLIASFMPKPLYQKAGSGMHVHFSVFKNGKNAFFEDSDKNKLSDFAKHFIAGILKYINEFCLLTNPTINSYKRLVKGYEAPVYVCWGSTNRSALIRIPRFTPGRESSTRGEIRCPDPTANPYLIFAAIFKAGMIGVENKLKLMPETMDSVYTKSLDELSKLGIKFLPESIFEAIAEFKNSEFSKELLGKELHSKFLELKEKDAEIYRTIVTEWEIEKYLE